MYVSGELHTSVLYSKHSKPVGCQVHSGHFREEKCHAPAGNRTPELTDHSPITTMTEVP